MPSFADLATVTASTKRPPTIVGGKRGQPATNLTSIKVVPIMPIDAELAARLNIETPFEVHQTFADGDLDIEEGDRLVIGTLEYDIRAVGDWPWQDGTDFKQIILEEIKGE